MFLSSTPSYPTPSPARVDNLLEHLRKSFADSYRVEEELKRGGMSRLFMATDLALNRKVVIKILPPELTSEMMATRFKREAEVTAHLQHPHILPIITAGLKDGLLYYVMPFISGESLRERLKREHQLPIADAVGILCEVASALAYAHKYGVIHRDIKPENVLLQDGQAVLADFGISAALAGPDHVTGERLTRTGMSIGTVGYMSPEQSLGGSDVDTRADIYSLGVVAYEMLAGTPPFAGTSTQAILAAHLTKPPPRIDRLREDVPIPISRAIEKALQKDPANRFQTASEFGSACATQTAKRSAISRIPVVRDLYRFPIGKIAAGVLVGALAFAGAWYVRHRAPQGPSESVTVVVAPFDVSTRALKVWHEGMVDLLARNMDGAGLLRVVPPVLAIRNWREGARSERETSVQLAQRTRAQYAIYGSLVPATADSVRLHFGLADAATDSVLADVDTIGVDVKQLANALTLRVVSELGKRHRIGAVRVTSIGSDSAQALKAFLEGEQFYRRASWDSASVFYARAVSIDTGFALALRRSGQVAAWRSSEADSATREFSLRAGARNHNLAPRDSLLIVADSLRSALDAPGDQPDWGLTRRLFATVNEAAARYPNDPEVWYLVGEARFHHGYGSMFDMSEPEIRDAFNRSVALDSSFAPAYIHLIELGFSLDGAPAGRAAALQFLAHNPAGAHADGVRLVDLVTDPARSSNASEVEKHLDSASSEALMRAWRILRRWPDSSETALRFLRALARHPRSSKDFAKDSVNLAMYLPLQLAYRGRLHESYLAMGNRRGRLFAQLAILGAIDPDTASAVFAEWLAAGNQDARSALAWWANRGDTASIIAFLRSHRARSAEAKAEKKAYAEYDSQAAQAYLFIARRDTTNAARAFALLSDTLCVRCDQDHLTTALLLAKNRDFGVADKILRQRLYSYLTPTEITIALARGKVAERAGQRDVARRSFRLVISAWRRGDPEVQGQVKEAQEGIRRLGGG
jgi:eukaryotic-like serine/threonine-protein kinase